jgi:hypothetical protein
MKNIFTYKRLWLLLCLPIGLLLIFIASKSVKFAEWYAITIYPILSLAVNFVTSLIPISIAELLVGLLIIGILLYFILYIRKIIKNKKNRKATVFQFILNPVCFISVILLVFALFCGINYYRYPFSQVSGLTVKDSPKSELVSLCKELAQNASKARENVAVDAKGVMKLSDKNIYQTAAKAKSIYAQLNKTYPTLKSGYGAPKPVLCSKLMSYSNITGMFFPFTFEANVNTDIPAFSIPSVMCHELTHLRGYMREDEANFVSYLACRQSGNPDFVYSGDMLAFVYANNALFDIDRTEGTRVYNKLSAGVRHDFAADSAYWRQFEGPIAQVSDKVNDTYLKANSQQDGVKSYGRMTDLLLADYRARHHIK